MRIFLEPNESLLFRTGRPFDAGETSYAESMFPPTPETLQGAIRAAIATHWDPTKTIDEIFRDPTRALVNLIGDRSSYESDNYGRFRVTSLTLGRRKEERKYEIERLFPVPAHLLKDEEGTIVRLKPQKRNDIQSIMQQKTSKGDILPYTMQYLFPESKKETTVKLKPINGWLTEENLYMALQATTDLTKLKIVSPHNVYVREPRVGIGMQNATKTTEEGMLYYVHMTRMYPSYGFVVDIRISERSDSSVLIDDAQTQRLLHLPPKGWIMLGGERRAARFEVLDPSTYQQESNIKQTGRLLYLSTPAYLEGGWQPKTWPTSITPIVAAIDRYKPIVGWLLNPGHDGGTQKSVRRCVPAGSIYFFDQFITIPQPLTDFGSHIGYGITYAGEW